MSAARTGHWINQAAKAGYATKGAVYCTIGVLALLAVAGLGGRVTDSQGVFRTVAQQPFGSVLLGVLAFGMITYASWQFARAAFGVGTEGKEYRRVGWAVRGAAHAFLAVNAIQLLLQVGGSRGTGPGTWIGMLMGSDAGRVVVAIVGLVIVGVGVMEIRKAITGKFLDDFTDRSRNLELLGKFGLAARGAVFILVGASFVFAAMHSNPSEARGMGGAMRDLSSNWMLLAVTALGLTSYGVFQIWSARSRKIEGHEVARRVKRLAA